MCLPYKLETWVWFLAPTCKCQAEVLAIIPVLERLDRKLSGALWPANLAELVIYAFSEVQWLKK